PDFLNSRSREPLLFRISGSAAMATPVRVNKIAGNVFALRWIVIFVLPFNTLPEGPTRAVSEKNVASRFASAGQDKVYDNSSVLTVSRGRARQFTRGGEL